MIHPLETLRAEKFKGDNNNLRLAYSYKKKNRYWKGCILQEKRTPEREIKQKSEEENG